MTYRMTYVIHVGKSYTVQHDISHDIYKSHHDISHDIFRWHLPMTYRMTYVIHVGKSYTVHHDISHDIYDSHHDISHDIFQHDISYDIYTLYVMSYARICQGSVECWRYVIRYVIRGGCHVCMSSDMSSDMSWRHFFCLYMSCDMSLRQSDWCL